MFLGGLLAASLKGREATLVTSAPGGPSSLSKADWKQVVFGVRDAFGDKHLPTLAAGVTYFAILAFFPLLAAIVAISAVLITPAQLDALLTAAEAYLPADISNIIASQLQTFIGRRTDNILAATIAVAVALFGASAASKHLVVASNVVYAVKESRGWLARQVWGVLWTLAAIFFGFLFMALLAVNRTLLEQLGLTGTIIPGLLYGRWLVIFLISVTGLSIFYRFGPSRFRSTWPWVSWGAVTATLAWIVATSLFFVYVQNFANFAQSYSLFAGIIILMIWMNLSVLIVLAGAEINYQLEQAGHARWRRALAQDAAPTSQK